MTVTLEMYYRAIVDCWRLFRKYRAPQQTQAYWEELHDEAHQIYARNQKICFVKHLLFVMLDEIDRVFVEQSKKVKK